MFRIINLLTFYLKIFDRTNLFYPIKSIFKLTSIKLLSHSQKIWLLSYLAQRIKSLFNSKGKVYKIIKKSKMQNRPDDLNKEIDRILSCNIRQDLFSGIPSELIQSPTPSKTDSIHNHYLSQSSDKRKQVEQDLYEKAEQIFKLKTLLESQLANINQILMENQKLTEANQRFKLQLFQLKNLFKQLKQSLRDQIFKVQKQIRNDFLIQTQNLRCKQNWHLSLKKTKMEISFCKQIAQKSFNIGTNSHQKKALNELHSFLFSVLILPSKKYANQFNSNTIQATLNNSNDLQFTKSLSADIDRLNDKIKRLTSQNILLHQKIANIQSLNANQPLKANKKNQKLDQKQLNYQQQSIQSYSSVFMKSIFQVGKDINQTIIKALFQSQNSIFDKLQQGKYFGKIISGSKNGNAIEKYTNGFQYEGNFLKNQRHGMGKLFYRQNLIYAGEWMSGKFSGKGILRYYLILNVQKIQANFKDGFISGYGTITFKSGYKIRARFLNNKICSDGIAILGQNCQNNLNRKSYQGKLQFINHKENSFGNCQIFFKTLSGQIININ